mmetsp:Transcript_15534/g.20252  ORF Transcript_15534/g.20252 Transcript_15534/m.20252 type:complete len:85 (+) Transcript_15534:223-477(+)
MKDIIRDAHEMISSRGFVNRAANKKHEETSKAIAVKLKIVVSNKNSENLGFSTFCTLIFLNKLRQCRSRKILYNAKIRSLLMFW